MTMKKFIMTVVVGAALTTAASASAATFVYPGYVLKPVARGSVVADLQTCLNTLGYNAGAVDGIYGNMTKAAVMQYQAAKGLVPVDGIIGSVTGPRLSTDCAAGSTSGSSDNSGSSMNLPEGCVPGAAYSSTTGEPCDGSSNGSSSSTFDTTSGEEGDIISIDAEAADHADKLRDDKKDQKAYKITVEADEDGSDVMVERMDLRFDTSTAPAEDDLYDIFDKITVKVDGKEVATKKVDDDSDWRGANNDTVRLTGINTVVKAGEEKDFEIYVDTQDLDAADMPLPIDLTNVEVRYVDEAGITDFFSAAQSETITIKQPDAFDMSFSEADANDDVPTTVNLSDDVSKQLVFATEAEVDDAQDGTLKDLDVKFNVNPIANGNLSDIVRRVYVYIDGQKIDSDKTPDVDTLTGGTASDHVYHFDLDDFKAEKGHTYDVAVKVDFKELPAAQEGTTIKVKELKFMGEDEEGDDFTPIVEAPSYAETINLSQGALIDKSVSVDGYDHVGGSDAIAKASYTVKLKADGDHNAVLDHFVFDVDGTATNVTQGSNVTVGNVSYTIKLKKDNEDGDDISLTTANDATINDGETKTYYVEFTATESAGHADLIELELTKVVYGLDTDDDPTTGTLGADTTGLNLILEKKADEIAVQL